MSYLEREAARLAAETRAELGERIYACDHDGLMGSAIENDGDRCDTGAYCPTCYHAVDGPMSDNELTAWLLADLRIKERASPGDSGSLDPFDAVREANEVA